MGLLLLVWGCQVVEREPDTIQDLDRDGYADGLDCNDLNSDIHPGADEQCTGVDEDCDGVVDEDVQLNTYYLDLDGDALGDPDNTVLACRIPENGRSRAGDCDDTDPDLGRPFTRYRDRDGDGYGDRQARIETCVELSDHVDDNDDCDDLNPDVHPGATDEADCEGVDWNCDEAELRVDTGAAGRDVVCVGAGTWEPRGRSLRLLRGARKILGPGSLDATVVLEDGLGGDTGASWEMEGVTLQGGETAPVLTVGPRGVRLTDVVIEGGACESCEASGLRVRGGAPEMTDVVVRNNLGVGVLLERSQVTWSGGGSFGNTVSGDGQGAGLALVDSTAELTGVAIAGNGLAGCVADGAGIYVDADSSLLLTRSAVVGNVANGTCESRGGGIYSEGQVTLNSTDVSHNRATCGHAAAGVVTSTWSNWYPGADAWCAGDAPVGADGNISVDPGYDLSSPNPADWLLRPGSSSDLIDAGDPSRTDPDGSRADIGLPP